MHDPDTLVKDFKFFSLWHHDPCKDGSDDSCGWFMRERHLPKEMIEEFVRWYDGMAWDDELIGLFKPDGSLKFSHISTTLQLFQRGAWVYYKHDWDKAHKFLNRHLAELTLFAENSIDSMHHILNNDYERSRKRRIEFIASIVLPYIARLERPWYKHPKFHLHHTEIIVPFLLKLKRFLKGDRNAFKNQDAQCEAGQ